MRQRRDARTGLRTPLGCFSTAVGSTPSLERANGRVTAAEMRELLAFERRLRHRGEDVTCAEWVAFFEAKADVFDRLAADPTSILGPTVARRVSWAARDEADRLRAEAAEWSWC